MRSRLGLLAGLLALMLIGSVGCGQSMDDFLADFDQKLKDSIERTQASFGHKFEESVGLILSPADRMLAIDMVSLKKVWKSTWADTTWHHDS